MDLRNTGAQSRVRSATIREIARYTEVSTASVSRALNGLDGVSPETARRIRKAARKFGYYPSSSARALVTGSSRIFGLLVANITNPFYADLLQEFEREAAREQYEVIVANPGNDSFRAHESVRRLLERNVDGVAIMVVGQTPLAKELQRRQIPIVFLDGKRVPKYNSNIIVDSSSGIQQAIDHLNDLGHRSIGYLGAPSSVVASLSRLQALTEAAQLRGMKLLPSFVSIDNQPTMHGGALGMAKLLQQRHRPTCVLTFNDTMAFGAMRAARQMKVAIPGDLSIVGFDDIEMAQYVEPQLSTIHFSRAWLASFAFKELLKMTRKIPHEESALLRTSLVVRSSTGPANFA
jgi:LacI family transcriptional regulator